MAYWLDKYVRFKEESKLQTRNSQGEEVDPQLLPINVLSKNHWSSTELAVKDHTSFHIDRESLKSFAVCFALFFVFP